MLAAGRTEYVLTAGRKCVIFQLIDDHSRFAVASHVAWGETSEGAIAVVKKAITEHGVPQRLLSDNGAALNPSRRGVVGQLVTYVTDLGVEAITGKPCKPTTQGKNERFQITPLQAWEVTPKADPPRPRKQQWPVGVDGIRQTRVARNGIVQVRLTRFHITWALAGQTVCLVETADYLMVFDDQGTQVMQQRWPKPGVKYVGSGRPRGRRPKTI